jgi:hypothetical protein
MTVVDWRDPSTVKVAELVIDVDVKVPLIDRVPPEIVVVPV